MCFYCFIDPLHKNDEILKCLCAHTPTYRHPVLTEIHCYGRLSTYPLLTSYLMLRAFIHRERERACSSGSSAEATLPPAGRSRFHIKEKGNIFLLRYSNHWSDKAQHTIVKMYPVALNGYRIQMDGRVGMAESY